jgi:hypothetical protein
MKRIITFTSKFNIGDIVTYDDRMTKPYISTIIDIKFTDSYQYMYRLEDKIGIWITDRNLTTQKTTL